LQRVGATRGIHNDDVHLRPDSGVLPPLGLRDQQPNTAGLHYVPAFVWRVALAEGNEDSTDFRQRQKTFDELGRVAQLYRHAIPRLHTTAEEHIGCPVHLVIEGTIGVAANLLRVRILKDEELVIRDASALFLP